MNNTNFVVTRANGDDELYHHGIKGQRWGVRRFQNDDGTLTEEGIRRYKTLVSKSARNIERINKVSQEDIDKSPRAARLRQKMAKYQVRQAKGLERVSRGKNMTRRQRKAVKKVIKIGKKLKRINRSEKIRARTIKQLTNQNKRYEKQISKMLKNASASYIKSLNDYVAAGKDYMRED